MLERLRPNGTLPITLGWKHAKLQLDITGGPYDAYPRFCDVDTFGVCVRAERVATVTMDVHLPIHDFSVPGDRLKTLDALRKALEAALEGKRVYIGCMGGWGRTGLFMALLAKAVGIENPVEYVRAVYTPKAVETEEQYRFVEEFDVEPIRIGLMKKAWLARFKRLFS